MRDLLKGTEENNVSLTRGNWCFLPVDHFVSYLALIILECLPTTTFVRPRFSNTGLVIFKTFFSAKFCSSSCWPLERSKSFQKGLTWQNLVVQGNYCQTFLISDERKENLSLTFRAVRWHCDNGGLVIKQPFLPKCHRFTKERNQGNPKEKESFSWQSTATTM